MALPGFAMGAMVYAWMLLTSLRMPPTMWTTLLAPLQGRLPIDDEELSALKRFIRKQSHLIENHPHNMTQQMKHPSIGAHHISFFGLDDYGTHEQSQSSWGGGETYQTDDYSQYPQHQDSMEDTIFNDGCWHSYQCFFGDSDTESDEE